MRAKMQTLACIYARTHMYQVRGSHLLGEGEHLLCRFDELSNHGHSDEPPPAASAAFSSASATTRSLVALSQQPRPSIDAGGAAPLRSADPFYVGLPLLMAASWDAQCAG